MSVVIAEESTTIVASVTDAAPPAKLSWPRLIAYALPNFSIGILIMPVATIIPSLYVKERGVALATMGVILMAARIFDAVADQIIGYLSDVTRATIPGGRKAWLLGGGAIALPSVFYLCAPPASAGAVYFVVLSLAAYLAWGMLFIPYTAWGAELSRGYHERTRIVAVRECVSQLGSLSFLAAPIILAYLGLAPNSEMDLHATRYVALSLLVLVPLTLIPALLFVPQGIPQRISTPVSFRAALQSLRRNGPMQIFAGAFLIGEIGYGIFATVFFFYMDAYLGIGTRFSHVIIAGTIATLASIPLWERLSRFIGKKNCVVLSWSGQAVTLVGFAFVPTGESGFAPLLALIVLSSLFIGSGAVVTPSILGDIVDYDTWKTRGYRAGAYFALYSLTLKIVVALGGGVALFALGRIGYDVVDPHTNSLDVNHRMLIVFAIVPALLKAASILIVRRYPLTAKRQQIIRKRLEERERRAARDAIAAKP